MAFRLNIDFELNDDEEHSADIARGIINDLKEALSHPSTEHLLERGQYKMTRDGDRGGQNYLNKNEDGKALTRKLQL